MNKIKQIIREEIDKLLNEATVEQDELFYNIADEFFEKMISELKDNNYIKQNDDNILFKASEINTNYHDLLIIFTDYNTEKTKPTFGNNTFKGGYSFGTWKQYKVIVINNLRPDMKEPYKAINKDGFIHEFIHYLDFKRSKGFSPKFNEKTSVSDYYNSPTEYNAYYQEIASFISNLLKDKKSLDIFKEKYKNFDVFYKWMSDNVFDKDFVKNLNDSNLRKLKKRIANIYQTYFVENIQEATIDPNSEVKNKLNQLTKKDKQLFDFYYQDNEGKTKIVKGKIIYVRFGMPQIDKQGRVQPSTRFVFNEPVESEDGISVFEAGWDGNKIAIFSPSPSASDSFDGLMRTKRKIYVVDGEIENGATGSDGEPLMIPNTLKIVTEAPREMIVFSS